MRKALGRRGFHRKERFGRLSEPIQGVSPQVPLLVRQI